MSKFAEVGDYLWDYGVDGYVVVCRICRLVPFSIRGCAPHAMAHVRREEVDSGYYLLEHGARKARWREMTREKR